MALRIESTEQDKNPCVLLPPLEGEPGAGDAQWSQKTQGQKEKNISLVWMCLRLQCFTPASFSQSLCRNEMAQPDNVTEENLRKELFTNV